ncbi:hypothetical protein K431DRAFT_73702 [Polychaeton citri CBS 116435]|uniref:Uncharacterized protein n=1 Tax=Polychaeton citri CBS 116435 TaxID=1314669 RepID=A0A9P4QA60_9PEZI|nr:hypothetical protein K431DRAFT_73702 [Polychaeton citri CBS 116435]
MKAHTAGSSDLSRIGLASEQLDLWEHACLLYRNYDWHAAADTFVQLAASADVRSRVKCCLNAALIQARLGDHANALRTLEVVMEIDFACPLTYFIRGLVECEQHDFTAAETSFDAALERLGNDGHACGDISPKFEITREIVSINKAVARAKSVGDIGAGVWIPGGNRAVCIPTECLFDAPERNASSTKPISERSSSSSAISGTRALGRRDDGTYSTPQFLRYLTRYSVPQALGLQPRFKHEINRQFSAEHHTQPLVSRSLQRDSILSVLEYYGGVQQSTPSAADLKVSTSLRPKTSIPSIERDGVRPSFTASTTNQDPIDEWLAELLRNEEEDDSTAVELPEQPSIFGQIMKGNHRRYENQDSPSPGMLRRPRPPSPHRFSEYVEKAGRFRMDNQDWKLPSRQPSATAISAHTSRFSDPVLENSAETMREDDQSALTEVAEHNRLHALRRLEGQASREPEGVRTKLLKRYCLFKGLPPVPPLSTTLPDDEEDELDDISTAEPKLGAIPEPLNVTRNVASPQTPSTMETGTFFAYRAGLAKHTRQ